MIGELARLWRGLPDPLLPGGSALVTDRLLPLLGSGSGVNEVDLLTLRNNLVDGGAMNTAGAAVPILAAYEEAPSNHGRKSEGPISALFGAVSALFREADLVFVALDRPFVLAGPNAGGEARPTLRNVPAGPPLPEGHVLLLASGGSLDLWPLCGYGKARSQGPKGERAASRARPGTGPATPWLIWRVSY